MNRYLAVFVAAATIGAGSCAGPRDVAVRPIKQQLAAGDRPINFRIAEGNSQMALGNVGLALEAYRKAMREDPGSVDAMLGLAAAYDRMGRFDLSRRHYEMALAVKPDQKDTYEQLAASLQMQGRGPEAAQVISEIAARDAAPEVSPVVPGSVPVPPPPPAPSVTVALQPAMPAPVAVALSPAVPAPTHDVAAQDGGPRLQRLSLAEVALVTQEKPRWKAQTVARTARSTTIQFVRTPPSRVTLLNAARVQGLAARTRGFLNDRGFAVAAIGDAPATRRQSAILYNPKDRQKAERIAAQFGFALQRQAREGQRLTVLLGRDAAQPVRRSKARG